MLESRGSGKQIGDRLKAALIRPQLEPRKGCVLIEQRSLGAGNPQAQIRLRPVVRLSHADAVLVNSAWCASSVGRTCPTPSKQRSFRESIRNAPLRETATHQCRQAVWPRPSRAPEQGLPRIAGHSRASAAGGASCRSARHALMPDAACPRMTSQVRRGGTAGRGGNSADAVAVRRYEQHAQVSGFGLPRIEAAGVPVPISLTKQLQLQQVRPEQRFHYHSPLSAVAARRGQSPRHGDQPEVRSKARWPPHTAAP